MVSMNLTSGETVIHALIALCMYDWHMNAGLLYMLFAYLPGRSKEFRPAYDVSMNSEHCSLLEFPALLAQQQQPKVSATKLSPVLTWEDAN